VFLAGKYYDTYLPGVRILAHGKEEPLPAFIVEWGGRVQEYLGLKVSPPVMPTPKPTYFELFTSRFIEEG
jgi:hypothetical protein